MNLPQEYAYIRVSTSEQNPSRQIAAMDQLNISKQNCFLDKKSGKDFERPEYQKLIKKLDKGDVLFIKSIDRLGRNYNEILEQWRTITKIKQADIVVLDMPMLDTRVKGKDLTGSFIADLVLQILSFVAESERDNIKQRQKEGIEQAKARGVQFGSPEKALPSDFDSMYQLYLEKKISFTALAKKCGLHRSTLYRKLEREAKINSK